VQQFDVGKKWEWVDLLKDFIYLRSEMSYLFALLACSFCSITTIAKGIIPLLKCCMPPMSFLGGGGGSGPQKRARPFRQVELKIWVLKRQVAAATSDESQIPGSY
jgi:hypothetical protein